VGAESLADGQTGREISRQTGMTKLIFAIRNLTNARKRI